MWSVTEATTKSSCDDYCSPRHRGGGWGRSGEREFAPFVNHDAFKWPAARRFQFSFAITPRKPVWNLAYPRVIYEYILIVDLSETSFLFLRFVFDDSCEYKLVIAIITGETESEENWTFIKRESEIIRISRNLQKAFKANVSFLLWQMLFAVLTKRHWK